MEEALSISKAKANLSMENERKDYSMPLDNTDTEVLRRVDITKEDPEFEAYLESIKGHSQYGPNNYIFGGQALHTIDQMTRKANIDAAQRIPMQREEDFRGLRELLGNFSQQDEYKDLFGYFLFEAIEGVPEFKNKFNEIMSQNMSILSMDNHAELSDDEIFNRILESGDAVTKIFSNRNVVNDALFEKILRNHRDQFLEKTSQFLETKQKMREDFAVALAKTVEQHGISLDKDTIEKRLESVKIMMVDGMSGLISTHTRGANYPSLRIVYINSMLRDEDVRHTLYHELMHEVSGSTFEDIGADKQVSRLAVRKFGLYRFDQDNRMYGREKYRWLNEAVTESLTYELLQPDEPTYTTEVLLFGELLKKSISPNILYDAYFENGKGTINEQGKSKWQQFIDTIDFEYTPGFLDRLDEYVSERGLGAALKAMHEDWRIIAQAHNYSHS